MNLKGVKALILTVSLSLIVGCGNKTVTQEDINNSENAAVTESNEKVLVYGSGDYSSINPALYEHGEINSLLFNGLTAHDKNNNIVPALAESWEYDKENLTYTFNLRKDVKWHDGEPFTAEDVKYTYEIITDPDVGSEIATNYEDIKEIQIVDDYTVKIILKNYKLRYY